MVRANCIPGLRRDTIDASVVVLLPEKGVNGTKLANAEPLHDMSETLPICAEIEYRLNPEVVGCFPCLLGRWLLAKEEWPGCSCLHAFAFEISAMAFQCEFT